MIKSELIKNVATRCNIADSQADVITNLFFNIVKQSIADGETLELRGFGTFTAKMIAPHTARNPKTGETVSVSASKIPHFKPSKKIKDKLLGVDIKVS